MLNTLVHKPLIHKASRWVIYIATHDIVYTHEGDPIVQDSYS